MIDLDALKAELATLRSLIDSDDDPQLWLDMLEGQGFNEVMESLLTRRQEAIAIIAGIKARQAEIATRRGRQEFLVEKLDAAMFTLLQLARLNTPLRLPEATLSISAGRDRVEITDEAALPRGLVQIEFKPKKAEIMTALKAGIQVPGARKVAGESSLRVQTK